MPNRDGQVVLYDPSLTEFIETVEKMMDSGKMLFATTNLIGLHKSAKKLLAEGGDKVSTQMAKYLMNLDSEAVCEIHWAGTE